MDLFEPIWTLVGLAFLAFMVAGGLLLVWESVGLFRDVVAMVLTRTSRIDSVGAGRVEVSGEVRPAERTLTDPVSGDEAVAYEYEASHERGLNRVIEGGDDRFVVAGGSQLRALVYNAGWGLSKLVGGLGLATGCGLLLVVWVPDLVGVSLAF